MALIDQVNEKYKEFLSKYPKGESTSSTSKYDGLEELLRNAFGIEEGQAYATGEGSVRPSNFGTRYTQGNKRDAHQRICFAFMRKDLPEGKDRDEHIQSLKRSWLATSKKFVETTEAGAIYDCIVLFIRLDQEHTVEPVCFISLAGDTLVPKIQAAFSGIEHIPVERLGVVPVPVNPLPGFTVKLSPGAKSVSPALVEQLHSDLGNVKLQYDKQLLLRFISSLLAKRFVLLAGLSGSGKTRLAVAVAKWFQESEDQVLRVAVGSDWTNNENVLGYRDALDPNRYVRPPTGVLDLMLAAQGDPHRPYFLVLDEMNLSHVERYFADVLSAMESPLEPMGLHSADTAVDDVPAKLTLPPNLFIVGTVNIDETTYMFSPKVLDRANVIEFRVSEEDLSAFLSAPGAVNDAALLGRGLDYAQSFVAASNGEVAVSSLPSEVAATDLSSKLNEALLALFKALASSGAEFGFRTAHEVYRFVYFHGLLSGEGWRLHDAVDAQVYQKLMPKLHGPERRLRPLLEKLHAVCVRENFRLSEAKIARMVERLKDGFASFIE